MKKKISVLLIFLLLIPVLSLSVSANQRSGRAHV